jgi:hypothetical protein
MSHILRQVEKMLNIPSFICTTAQSRWTCALFFNAIFMDSYKVNFSVVKQWYNPLFVPEISDNFKALEIKVFDRNKLYSLTIRHLN